MRPPRTLVALLAFLLLATGQPIMAVDGADTSLPRIKVRQADGVAEFYRTDTGDPFVPRGVNYIDFVRDENGSYRDAVFATATFDPARVQEAFSNLADHGYNTVRIFFDTCGVGRYCIGMPGGRGLQPAYLDNMTEVMHIAAETGIYLLLTANSIPDDGGYWEYFDGLFGEDHPGFTRRENADWLHTAGVETKALFWDDLLSGLAARDAPFETVLGWQLTNEQWLFREHPPLALDSGFAQTANGERYDLSRPGQQRRMVADGLVYFIDRLREVISEHDPEGLVTMGWFAPYFGSEWYVDTKPMLERADLDFFDFHAYGDTGLSPRDQARSFGMIGYDSKPIIMGELGVGTAVVPTAASAIANVQRWIADSCKVGFDGWLNWGYYSWPEDLGGAAWTFLDDDAQMLEALAPVNQPDPCVIDVVAGADVARTASVTATRSAPGQPPRNAIDGGSRSWVAGDYPPQTFRLKLERPASVGQLGLAVDQWPAGAAHHRVWATLRDGRKVLMADIERYLHATSTLDYVFATPVPGVKQLHIETVELPSWVGWREISVVAAKPAGKPCLVDARAVRIAPRASARVSTRLGRGQLVLAEARWTHDPAWLRTPGDHWVRGGVDVCPELPLVEGPRLDLVPVTFEVRVPATSGEVYFAGDFTPETALPVWDPATVWMSPNEKRLRRATVPLPRGQRLEYKYTQAGTWDGAETDRTCTELADRQITVEPGLVVRDRVMAWMTDC